MSSLLQHGIMDANGELLGFRDHGASTSRTGNFF